MRSKQKGQRPRKGRVRGSERTARDLTARRLRDPNAVPQRLAPVLRPGSMGGNDGFDETSISPLRDGGIRWVFYLWKSEVPEPELARIARSARAGFLRAAVTFGFPDWDSEEYRSTTTVHLWDLGDAYSRGFRPPDGDWGRMMVHIFVHEPLHHAIGLCLAELFETGDQEWVISRLGDARWW